jgi:hypothetical protein
MEMDSFMDPGEMFKIRKLYYKRKMNINNSMLDYIRYKQMNDIVIYEKRMKKELLDKKNGMVCS